MPDIVEVGAGYQEGQAGERKCPFCDALMVPIRTDSGALRCSVCSNKGVAVKAKRLARKSVIYTPPDEPAYETGPRKSVTIAALASFFLPGTGQMYAGQWSKGLGFFVGYAFMVIVAVSLVSSGIDFVPGIVFLVYAVWSSNGAAAYVREQNSRRGHPSPPAWSTRRWLLVIAGCIAFVILIAIIASLA